MGGEGLDGIQTVNGSFLLSAEQKEQLVATEAHEQGTVVAQIFSGIFFSGVAGWLTVSNGTKLAFVQKAALEKRLTVCCFFNIYVAFFSAFFNFFQLTSVDDVLLEAAGNFTLDLARPIEWVMTCPLMQLSLVIMGGAKLPEYRRYLMPAFSFTILNLGTAGAFFGDDIFGVKVAAFLLGVSLFCVMVYFNRLQIVEYSNGQEGLLSGDSEFRKATVLLIMTWAPFPCWYVVSPEGIGLVTNTLVIQLGWAFLNIVSKFSFIFYIQRCKDMYCNRLKTKRELQPAKMGPGHGHRNGYTSPPGELDFSGAVTPGLMSAAEYEQQEADKKKAQLSAVVVETMTFLGMAQHTERFLSLLERSNMQSIYDVEALDQERCAEMQLPMELVSAVQRRLRVWKLEMVDDAEVGLDKGEEYWIKKGGDVPSTGEAADGGQMPPFLIPGMMPVAMEQNDEQNQRLAEIEDLLRQKLRSEETILHESRSKGELLDKSVEGLATKLQAAMEAMEQRMLARLSAAPMAASDSQPQLQATRDVSTASQRSEVRAFEMRITAKLDELHTVTEQQRRHELHTLESRINTNLEQQVGIMMTKMDMVSQRIEACSQKTDMCSQQLDTRSSEQLAKVSETAIRLADKVDEVARASQSGLDALKAKLETGLAQVGTSGQTALEKMDALAAQTRAGTESLAQKTEGVLASQTKSFAAHEDAWRSRINELEANLACRDDEVESAAKRRYDELVRLSSLRKVEDLAAQLLKTSERTDQAIEAVGGSVASELHAVASRLASKSDSVQAALLRQLGDVEAAAQRRADEAHSQAQEAGGVAASRFDAVEAALGRRTEAIIEATQKHVQALGAAMKKDLEGLASTTQSSTERSFSKTAAALEALEASFPKRLDDAIAKVASDAALSGAAAAERRAEKAVEALATSHRSDVQAATSTILEGVNDVSSSQARKATEREDRSLRRIEELLEVVSNRATQKTEDVGVEVKKELHGFAKRLNSKIPFM